MHVIRQAVVVINKEKNKSNNPVMIAPAILAVAISIISRITDVRIAPNIPVKIKGRTLHIHLSPLPPDKTLNTPSPPKKATAIPKSAHKKGVGTVIVPEKVKKPAIIPTTMLTNTAMAEQLNLQLHINFTSYKIVCKRRRSVN